MGEVTSLLLLLLLRGALCSDATTVTASVYGSPSKIHPGEFDYSVEVGVTDENALAYGSYDKDVDANGGWRVLNLHAGYAPNSNFSDKEILFAAGVLEGYLTQKEIYELWTNVFDYTLKQYTSQELKSIANFYETQREWAQEMVGEMGDSQNWHYTSLILSQFQGLVYGYSQATPQDEKLELFAFDFLNGFGDFLDYQKVLFPSKKHTKWTYQDYLNEMYRGHCSVLIKLLPGYENLLASHTTWFDYVSMTRIYKHYAIRVSGSGGFKLPSSEVMSFSSYPAFLSSLDDFYLMDNGIVMLQTTNAILNVTVLDLATPRALLAWHRVRLANWLASTGQEWAETFQPYNSGTYNNQYMVIDLKRIKLQVEVLDNALWIVEQIPGYVMMGDQTAILRDGYWASYNVPFYENIYEMSGYKEAEKAMGGNVYQLCPRAKIFRRDHGMVTDMETLKTIMRYSNYKEDPYAENNPMNTICSRGDLLDKPFAGGCTDTKVTDYSSALKLEAYAVNGPTAQGVPPFTWSKSSFTTLHTGQPDVFNYTFARMAPKTRL